MDFKVKDLVIIKDGVWFNNEDLGGRLGVVVSTFGHLLINVYDYHSNPVKCFRSDVFYVESPTELTEEELEEWMDDWPLDDQDP